MVTAPVSGSGPSTLDRLAAVVAGDALRRQVNLAEVIVPVATGDLAAQWAVERDLAREGLDRSTVSTDGFVERMRSLEADVLDQIGQQLDDLRVVARTSAASSTAVRAAFVRLYDQGLLVEDEHLVRACPRCTAVVQRGDVETAEAEAQVLTLDIDGLELEVLELELLPGVVAIAVPAGDPSAETTVTVPLGGRAVPVLAAEVDHPTVLIPAHREMPAGLRTPPPVAVLDRDGVVRAPGPLQGLSRYAARAAAAELLAAEGVVVDSTPAVEQVQRCRHCGTSLVPVLERQWFLRSGALEVAVADAIREGAATIAPSDLRERVLAEAGEEALWCITGGPVGGHPVPASICLDCGRLAVEVEPGGTCGACMGTTEPGSTTLDGSFVTVAALVDQLDAKSVVVVDAGSLAPFALRLAAVALRLNGELPFSHLAVHPTAPLPPDAPVDRLTLLGAAPEAVDDLVAMLRRPPVGDGDVDALASAVDGALTDGTPSVAVVALTTALAGGVPEADRDRVAAIAAPLVGTDR